VSEGEAPVTAGNVRREAVSEGEAPVTAGNVRREAVGEDGMARAYARARARDAAIRAQLVPLAPGERPPSLVAAAVVATLLVVANLALLIGGWEVDGEDPSTAFVLGFAALMAAVAAGLWQRRYWAVLGFEAALAIAVTWAGLSLLLANNVAAVLLCLAVVAGGGVLFWKLVRVMARIQAAGRRDHEAVG
jgi:MYXO-CTERM domain-containing protein